MFSLSAAHTENRSSEEGFAVRIMPLASKDPHQHHELLPGLSSLSGEKKNLSRFVRSTWWPLSQCKDTWELLCCREVLSAPETWRHE